MKMLFKMFFTFAKVGAVTFGGGYAMLPILQREIVSKNKWATDEELMDYYAIGQCTPGVIAVNTATFVGYKKKGIPGALFSTFGVVFPSVLIITIIAAFITNYADLEIVKYAFSGIRVAVCVLIFNSILKLSKKSLIDKWTYIIFALCLVFSLFLDMSVVALVVLAGLSGFLIKKFEKKGGEK